MLPCTIFNIAVLLTSHNYFKDLSMDHITQSAPMAAAVLKSLLKTLHLHVLHYTGQWKFLLTLYINIYITIYHNAKNIQTVR